MNDNVQPLHAQEQIQGAPPLPEMGSANSGASTGPNVASSGVSAELPDPAGSSPMPAWFMGLILLIVLIIAGGAYVGYLVLSDKVSLPGAANAPLEALAAAPPTPESVVDYQIDFGSSRLPAIAQEEVPRSSPEVALTRPVPAPAFNVEAVPTFTPHAQHEAVSLPLMLEINTKEMLSEHSERLLALEVLAGEHSEVLALMKDELQSTKRQLSATDRNIAKAIKRIDGLTGKAIKTTASTQSNTTKRSSTLPFSPLSYRTFGEQVSVRVRAPLQKAQSLRVGQALLGWRLLSADPVVRTAVFLNVTSFKKQEVSL